MGTRGTYRTIHSSLPDDPEFQQLSATAQHVFYTIRVSKEHGASGIFRYYPEVVAARCHLSVKRVMAALQELARTKRGRTHGWIVYDDSVLWVVNGLRYDPHLSLANEKHKKTVCREISELPTRQIVLSYCDYYKLPYPFDTHSLQYSESDSESESKDTDTTSHPPRAEEAPAWPSPEALVAKYNREATDNCPAVVSMSPKRREKARRYLRQFPDEAWWTATFRQYHRSRFLSGKAPPGNGHASFVPDFDWLLSVGKDGSENVVKVHDGRYCDAQG